MKVEREGGHFLDVEDLDGERTWSVAHPSTCKTQEEPYPAPNGEGHVTFIRNYLCLTAAMLDVFELDEGLTEGRYEIEAWYTPPGWAGSFPIEADGGIDVLRPAS